MEQINKFWNIISKIVYVIRTKLSNSVFSITITMKITIVLVSCVTFDRFREQKSFHFSQKSRNYDNYFFLCLKFASSDLNASGTPAIWISYA